MGKSTSILPNGISRYRVFTPVPTKFSFYRAYELKSDAENLAGRLRRGKTKRYRARVVPIKARVHGVLYRYAVYRKKGRDRASKR